MLRKLYFKVGSASMQGGSEYAYWCTRIYQRVSTTTPLLYV